MGARKKTGRAALTTPTTALTKVRDPKDIGKAANEQRAADVFVGTAVRSLRRFTGLRLQDADLRYCLRQLTLAAEAVSSAMWAVEYEAGSRDRGEQ